MKKILLILTACICTMANFGQTRSFNPGKTQAEKLNDQYCTGLFKTDEGAIFDFVSDNTSANGYFNILDWLEGRVAGLQVVVLRNGVRIPVIRGSQAGIFVDEMQVSADFLNSLFMNDIAMIKVIKTPFLGGFNGAGGAIAIYTLVGGDDEE